MGTQGDGCAPIRQTSQSSYIIVPVQSHLSTILVDTGASHSFISKHIFDNEFPNMINLCTYEKKINCSSEQHINELRRLC